jgi:hypothetical protein
MKMGILNTTIPISQSYYIAVVMGMNLTKNPRMSKTTTRTKPQMPQNRAEMPRHGKNAPAPVSLGAKQPNRPTNDLNDEFGSVARKWFNDHKKYFIEKLKDGEK